MVRFKPEVRIFTWCLELHCIFLNASMWSTRTGVGVHISSIDDGKHGATTLHGLGLAVDMNVDTFEAVQLESLYQYMRKTMPKEYDVIFEVDHVHVEWDAKRPEMRMVKT